jgi:hypothetical protein
VSRLNAAGVAAVPLVVVAVGFGLQAGVNRDMMMFWSVVGIGVLAALLTTGFRYYAAHPLAGLLTALCLAALFPLSQAAIASDLSQMVFGILSGGVGTVLVAVFTGLVVAEMRGEAEEERTYGAPGRVEETRSR